MAEKRNIFLVGPMGAGKSTIGRQLAQQLNMDFVDSDAVIEERAGADISWIFDLEGEEGFRKREERIINELTQLQGVELSTGGGAVMSKESRNYLSARGIVIYLETTVDKQYQRTQRDKKRPLLQGADDPRQVLEDLAKVRNPLYEEIADITLPTDEQNAKVMVNQIVDLKERRYPIYIGEGLLKDETCYPLKKGDKVMIVTNPTVAQYYLETVTQTLEKIGCQVESVLLPDGEKYKTLDSLNLIFTALLKHNHGRDTTIIALGGGVIGDVAGFAAASYQRGVRFIQIPTTLLAQVDSSVGGKTAVNHELGKNMIGAFYQPSTVIIDTLTLNTLPKREVNAGLAEVIKYGVILDYAFFEWLEAHIDELVALNQHSLQHCIARCCQIKADVVARDETEKGDRALLNLGHTFGHAIETHLGYGNWLHGEAVAAGTMMAAVLSEQLGDLSFEDVARLEKLLARANLPTVSPDTMQPDDYLPHMMRDKKVLAGKLRLVLLKALGKAYVATDTDKSLVLNAIERCTQHD